jgi:hypothetical protein
MLFCLIYRFEISHKTLNMLCSQGVIVSSSAHIDQNRDLAADVQIAQSKLSAYIQQCVYFSSTYQIITNSDIKIEVFNIFQEIYALLEQLQVWISRLRQIFFDLTNIVWFQVSQTVINQIEFLAEQDIALLSSATLNMLAANSLILGRAYEMNLNMRNNSLDAIPPLYERFTNEDTNDFNLKHNMYLAALLVTGNILEGAVLLSIEGQVFSFCNSRWQKFNLKSSSPGNKF